MQAPQAVLLKASSVPAQKAEHWDEHDITPQTQLLKGASNVPAFGQETPALPSVMEQNVQRQLVYCCAHFCFPEAFKQATQVSEIPPP